MCIIICFIHGNQYGPMVLLNEYCVETLHATPLYGHKMSLLPQHTVTTVILITCLIACIILQINDELMGMISLLKWIVLRISYHIAPQFKIYFSAKCCAAGGGLNLVMISHALSRIYKKCYSYLLGFPSSQRPNLCGSHPEDPPRPFNWSVTNLLHATLRLSLNTTVSPPPPRLASDWCVCRPCSSDELPENQLFAANTFQAKATGPARILSPL